MHAYPTGWRKVRPQTGEVYKGKKERIKQKARRETGNDGEGESEVHVGTVTRAPRVVPAAHGHAGPLTSRRRFLTVPRICAVVLGVMTMFLGVMAMLLRVMTMLMGVVVAIPSRLWLRRRMRMLEWHARWLGHGVGCGAAGRWAGARAWARVPKCSVVAAGRFGWCRGGRRYGLRRGTRRRGGGGAGGILYSRRLGGHRRGYGATRNGDITRSRRSARRGVGGGTRSRHRARARALVQDLRRVHGTGHAARDEVSFRGRPGAFSYGDAARKVGNGAQDVLCHRVGRCARVHHSVRDEAVFVLEHRAVLDYPRAIGARLHGARKHVLIPPVQEVAV
jgi:hypothetical protein